MEGLRSKSGKSGTALTPDEVDLILKQVKDKETRLNERSKAMEEDRDNFYAQRDKFELEREKAKIEQENTRRDFDAIKRGLDEREYELAKRNEAAQGHLREVSVNDEVTRKIDELRQEIEFLKGTPCVHPRDQYPQPPAVSHGHSDNFAPRVSFRDALESVPNFDGYDISLTQFARACRRARDIIPPSSEGHLTRLLVNKLRGRAYYAVEDEPCETVARFLDLLSGAFGPPKTINQYRGELSTIYLLPQEHMLDYIARVKELRSSIIDAEHRETGRTDNVMLGEIDALTARSFCEGLPLEYRIQLRGEHFVRPFEAFALAKTLAKRQELERERYGMSRSNNTLNTPSNDTGSRATRQFAPTQSGPRNNESRNAGQPNFPRNSWNRGPPPQSEQRENWRSNLAPRYSRADSRQDTPVGGGQPTIQPHANNYAPVHSPRSFPGNAAKICRYCKIQGHELEECRKRQRNNSFRQSGNFVRPPGNPDNPQAGPPQTQIRPVTVTEIIPSEESQP